MSLGDTLGVGTPADVQKLFTVLLAVLPKEKLAGHFHDTYGQAIANVVKSYDMGIRTFDSSVAGLGGCPFAPGAKGNLATEDLVYTLHRMGVKTGVDLNNLAATGTWISRKLGIPNGSRAGAALAAAVQTATPVLKPSPSASTARRETTEWTNVDSTPEFNVTRSGPTLKITLTRPRNGNALTKQMLIGLTRIFTSSSSDKSLSRILLCATGKFFCTGMDLSKPISPTEQFTLLHDLFEAIDACPQTTAAFVNGPAFGGGVGLAFVCDLRIVRSNATFKLTEVRLGLCPAVISKYVIREWGLCSARTAMLTARDVTPRELLALGKILKVVTNDAEWSAAEEEVIRLLQYTAPRAAGLCKDLVTSAWKEPGTNEQADVIQSAFQRMMAAGAEAEYGLSQFRKGIKGVNWDGRGAGEEAPKSKL